jgi:Ion channel
MLILHVVVAVAAVLMIVVVMLDAFETVVLPRRVSRRFRLTRLYFRSTWRGWSALARRIDSLERRESILAIFGPLALLLLLALWVALLIFAYGLLYWALGSQLVSLGHTGDLGADVYFSGTTLLTLGLGDVYPHVGPTRAAVVVEVGTGFGLLALVIGYLPVLYQAFSRREMRISLLDARAGSPPTAGALLKRHPPDRRARKLANLLAEWESWAAELLETHLSYAVLAYYRSQHEDQSWVAALAVILDTCALVLACGRTKGVDGELAEQAAFTFATARHAAVDLEQIFRVDGRKPAVPDERLSPADRVRLREILGAALGDEDHANHHDSTGNIALMLDDLRALYEPYLAGLSAYLLMPLPRWVPTPGAYDDWQTTADGVTAPSILTLSAPPRHPTSAGA